MPYRVLDTQVPSIGRHEKAGRVSDASKNEILTRTEIAIYNPAILSITVLVFFTRKIAETDSTFESG